jgi:hypothetical protein
MSSSLSLQPNTCLSLLSYLFYFKIVTKSYFLMLFGKKKKFMVIQRINNIFFNALFFFHGIYPNTIFFFTDLTFELIISLRNVTLHLTLLVWDTCIDKSFLKSLENKMWNLEKIQERGKKKKKKETHFFNF